VAYVRNCTIPAKEVPAVTPIKVCTVDDIKIRYVRQAKKEELLHILKDVDSEAATIESMGQGMIHAARLSRDVASPMLDIITNLPLGSLQPGQLDGTLASWRDWKESTHELKGLQPAVSSFVAVSSGTTNTAVSFVSNNFFPSQQVQDAKTRLFQVLDRSPLVEQVRSSMIRLGLNSRGGNARTALDLLDEAQAALERPVIKDGGPTSVLIALRESIDATITELIRRRPIQEKVHGWNGKVLSLGQHCAYSGLRTGHFDRLGTEADGLMSQLSSYKQDSLSRDAMNELFIEGITLLKALLDSIDAGKLRA
jgi:hypothetical protein